MGRLRACDILSDVAYSLISQPTFTQIGVSITPGVRTVPPLSMAGIYLGAQLVVGSGASLEVVTVTAVTTTTFTATFLNSHTAVDPVIGPTFPEGQPDHVLFTQNEMLQYLVDAQKDFLLKTRLIYSIETPTLLPGQYYNAPSRAIRIERIAVPEPGALPNSGKALLNDSQSGLDLMTPLWSANQNPSQPKTWFQDQIDTAKFGFYPPYQAGGAAEIWYSDRGPDSLTMMSTLTVPDAFCYALRYSVLQRAWTKDGEQRSPERAMYARKRYDMCVVLATRFMLGVEAALMKQEEEERKFSPMAVPA